MAIRAQRASEGVTKTPRIVVDDLRAELRMRARSADEEGDVRLIETHVSWVLVDDDVYKIKKPVTLPFVDFSTFEAREEACRNEVRLNRRLAPRTYLGVQPIRRDALGHYTLAPSGPIVDWAVRMRRLDERGRADALLEAGELHRDLIDRLAVGIATFHADARADASVSAHGRIEAVERHVLDNFAALRSYGRFLSIADLTEIERWQREFLRREQGRFAERIASGAVREGHGDLRLEHVFFRPDGDFDVIDAVEFDERLRCADVCADVAFLAMDLARLGRVDLGERFLAVYARTANDYDLYRLVDFYESYRACVRAKISAMCADDARASDEARAHAMADARRYLLVALSAGRRSLVPPCLVAVAGGIAAGKSTVAERIGEELCAPIVDADRTRKHMIGLAPTAHADAAAWKGPYDPAFSEQVYAEVLRRAESVLSSGRSVVVDASFRTANARASLRALAEAHHVPLRLFECVAPAEVCKRRLESRDRGTSVSDGRLEVYDSFQAGFEPIIELAPTEHIRVDTTAGVEPAMAQVTATLATWPHSRIASR